MASELPELPLPPLRATLQRTLQWLRPLVDDKTYAQSTQAVQAFGSGAGQLLQEMLQVDGQSRWHQDHFCERRLRDHRSLPLSGNIAFAIDWHARQRGVKRVAHFINALLHVHRDYLGKDFQATPGLCMEQWQVLRGASRRAQIPCDVYRFASGERAHIVIIHGGRGWKLDVFDEKKRIAHPAQLEKALDAIIAAGEGDTEMPFGAASVLPGQQVLEIRAQLVSRDDNQRIWQSLDDALFVLNLNSERHNDGTDGLFDALFAGAANLWAYKPLNYDCHYRDDRFYVHSESTWVNAGVLQDILRRAQQQHSDGQYACNNTLPAALDAEALEWTIEQNTRELLSDSLAQYQQQAEKMALTAVDIFITDDERHLLNRLPADALIQLLLQYAQSEVYGRIRSIHKAVDMRHFRHGRVDIMRPVTMESLAAVKAMQTGTLTYAQLSECMQAHETRLGECWDGEGISTHLMALQEANREMADPSFFFRDEGLVSLQENFFTTGTLGAYDAIAALAFAPPHAQGLGIHYAFNRNNINMMITHRRSDVLTIKALGNALRSGVRQIINVMMA